MKLLHNRLVVLVVSAAALWTIGPGCRRDDTTNSATGNLAIPEPEPAGAELVFPPSLRVADETVNEFVTGAMAACAGGDYDLFRSLWVAREDPLPRDEFERGWRAVQRVQIKALERVSLGSDGTEAKPQPAYTILAEVTFDPDLSGIQQEPQRQTILMIVREHDEWRLARAPKAMKSWLADKVKATSSLPPAASDPTADVEPG